MKLSVKILILLGVIIASVYAIPEMINYQGKLTDPDGVAIEGVITVEFSIYNLETGGSPLWSEAQDVTISHGLFDVRLGTVEPFPDSLDFSEEEYFIELSLGSDILEPRQLLTTVPFAFRAAIADSISGGSAFTNLDQAYDNSPSSNKRIDADDGAVEIISGIFNGALSATSNSIGNAALFATNPAGGNAIWANENIYANNANIIAKGDVRVEGASEYTAGMVGDSGNLWLHGRIDMKNDKTIFAENSSGTPMAVFTPLNFEDNVVLSMADGNNFYIQDNTYSNIAQFSGGSTSLFLFGDLSMDTPSGTGDFDIIMNDNSLWDAGYIETSNLLFQPEAAVTAMQGVQYFDSDDNTMYYYNGSEWIPMDAGETMLWADSGSYVTSINNPAAVRVYDPGSTDILMLNNTSGDAHSIGLYHTAGGAGHSIYIDHSVGTGDAIRAINVGNGNAAYLDGKVSITDTLFANTIDEGFGVLDGDIEIAATIDLLGNNIIDLGYINFGSSEESSGYGFRDNSGVLEYKHQGHFWRPIGYGSSYYIQNQDDSLQTATYRIRKQFDTNDTLAYIQLSPTSSSTSYSTYALAIDVNEFTGKGAARGLSVSCSLGTDYAVDGKASFHAGYGNQYAGHGSLWGGFGKVACSELDGWDDPIEHYVSRAIGLWGSADATASLSFDDSQPEFCFAGVRGEISGCVDNSSSAPDTSIVAAVVGIDKTTCAGDHYAGLFMGDVHVTGDLTVDGSYPGGAATMWSTGTGYIYSVNNSGDPTTASWVRVYDSGIAYPTALYSYKLGDAHKRAIYAFAGSNATSGNYRNMGILAEATGGGTGSDDGNAYGVVGFAQSNSSYDAVGIFGQVGNSISYSTIDLNGIKAAVYGCDATGSNYAGYFTGGDIGAFAQGTNEGLRGVATGTSGGERGVFGHVAGTGGSNVGVYGYNEATGSGDKYGVMGSATGFAASGSRYGVRGMAYGATNNYAVFGDVGGNPGYGVWGQGGAADPYGYLGGQNYGVYANSRGGTHAAYFDGDVFASGDVGIGTVNAAAKLDVNGYIVMRTTMIKNTGFEAGDYSNWSRIIGTRTPDVIQDRTLVPEGKYAFGHSGDHSSSYGTSDRLVWGIEQDVPDYHVITEASRLRFYTYGGADCQYHHWHVRITYTDATSTVIDDYPTEGGDSDWRASHGLPSGQHVYWVDLYARGSTLGKTIDKIAIEIHKCHTSYLRYAPEVYIDGIGLLYE